MSRNKTQSLMKKIVLPVSIIMLLQAVLFCGVAFLGGTIETITENSVEILNERVINRKNYLQTEMIQRWSNLDSAAETVNQKTLALLNQNDATAADLRSESPLASETLSAVTEDVIYLLRKNETTGAFVVFNGMRGAADGVYPGFYVRSADPASNSEDNSDLLIERAPSQITKDLKISTNTTWTPYFSINSDGYFVKPLSAALEHPDLQTKDLAYWSQPFYLSEDTPVITYSMPLRLPDGTIYGVIGVDISLSYLRTVLPYTELTAGDEGVYLLAVKQEGSDQYQRVLSCGATYQKIWGSGDIVSFEEQEKAGNVRRVEGTEENAVYGCIQPIQLYNSNTPFSGEQWALIGLLEESILLRFVHKLEATLAVSLVISLIVGLLLAFFVGRVVSRPITTLSRKVKESDPRLPIRLEHTQIREVDDLADSVERLSRKVAAFASKMTTIFSLSGMPVGTFEWSHGSDQVNIAGDLLLLLGVPQDAVESGFLPSNEFERIMRSLGPFCDMSNAEEGDATRKTMHCRISRRGEPLHWIRFQIVSGEERVLGVVTDITRDMIEKRRLEYERDYDLLTNLLNRRAFYFQMKEKFSHQETLGIGALIMLDLDNLKYINDTYGHDCGDEYIRCAANALKKFVPYQTIIARMSGDEFYVFIYGYDNRTPVRHMIADIQHTISNSVLTLPDKSKMKIRASAGYAWYPDDSRSFEELIRFADFAMYKVKNTNKGRFREFDAGSYHHDSYLLSDKESLNRLIEEELLNYHFQPILDAHSGEIFAYEALMRACLPEFQFPLKILTLARAQFKLYEIERLSWFRALDTFDQKSASFGAACRLFINSIANQILSERDFNTLEARFLPLLPRVVMELTEDEKLNEDFAERKRSYIRKWHAEMALDDFGTGYNGEAALLSLSPDYVKIDMSIIRDIDTDENKQKVLANLISYSHASHIRVIAEGIETRAEMETLIRGGVDYLQGFYLGRPQPEPGGPTARVVHEILQANSR